MISWVAICLCITAGALSDSESQALSQVLTQTLVAPDTVQEEVGAYVRSAIPAFTPPTDAAAWAPESDRLRKAFLEQIMFRGVPKSWRAPETHVEWRDTIQTGKGYAIHKLIYEALPGLRISALLYLPDGLTEKAPAVLNVNGHVGPPGKAIEEDQIRSINLAKRGIISLHPEWFSFGELQGDGYNHNRLAYLDLVGASGVSVFYLALERALDVLDQHPQVDRNRIAVTGLSGGGWQTIVISALDERVAACAPNAGYIGIDVRTHYPGDIGDVEQIPTDFLTVGDYTHMTALLAPRPTLLIYNARDNCCFEASHAVPAIYGPLLPWYALYNATSRYTFHINEDPGTHNYGKDNREAFYRFLRRELVPEAVWNTVDIPVDGEIYTPEELYAGLGEGNENFITLAKKLYDNAAKPVIPGTDDPGRAAWQQEQRNALSSLLRYKPAAAQAGEWKEAGADTVAIRSGVLTIGGQWSVPVVALSPKNTAATAATVMLSDAGMSTLAEAARNVVEGGQTVVLVDLLFLGQTKPHGNVYQYPMMMNATGGRALAVQAAQVAAVAEWTQSACHAASVKVTATGWNAATAALLAAALTDDAAFTVDTHDVPESLYALIEQEISYNDKPSLFAFGLLPMFDLPVLRALAE